MDPNETWKELVYAAGKILDEHTYPWSEELVFTMAERIEELNDWFLKLGFPPRGVLRPPSGDGATEAMDGGPAPVSPKPPVIK